MQLHVAVCTRRFTMSQVYSFSRAYSKLNISSCLGMSGFCEPEESTPLGSLRHFCRLNSASKHLICMLRQGVCKTVTATHMRCRYSLLHSLEAIFLVPTKQPGRNRRQIKCAKNTIASVILLHACMPVPHSGATEILSNVCLNAVIL